jgi:hypothetical protein
MNRPTKCLILSLVILCLLVPALLISPSSLIPKAVEQIDGLHHLLSIEGITGETELWHEDFMNTSSWTVSNSVGATGSVVTKGVVEVIATFSSSSFGKTVSVSRDIDLSLSTNPSICLTLMVSEGVSYGIRFFGVYPNGTGFSAWSENTYLQHRPGLGLPENISANLAHEAYFAIGESPPPTSRIVQIVIYIEGAPTTIGQFSMTLSGMTAYSFQKSVATNGSVMTGNLKGLLINLESIPIDESIFQVYIGFNVDGSRDLVYDLYFTRGLSVLAQGFTYRLKSITSYELAVLSPSLIRDVPPFLLGQGSVSLIIMAQRGELTNFKLDSLTLRYWRDFPSSQVAPQSLQASFLWRLFLLYVVLLFVIPVNTVALLHAFHRNQE